MTCPDCGCKLTAGDAPGLLICRRCEHVDSLKAALGESMGHVTCHYTKTCPACSTPDAARKVGQRRPNGVMADGDPIRCRNCGHVGTFGSDNTAEESWIQWAPLQTTTPEGHDR